MKKMTRMACLVAALALSGDTTAGAWSWENCYYGCGHVESVPYGACCGSFHAEDWSYAVASDSKFCE